MLEPEEYQVTAVRKGGEQVPTFSIPKALGICSLTDAEKVARSILDDNDARVTVMGMDSWQTLTTWKLGEYRRT